MRIETIADLENDGLNLAADGAHLYARCMRRMLKYALADARLCAQRTIFEKDGKARAFSVGKTQIFLTDFCDLYVLNKEDLRAETAVRIGKDLSSDLGAVRFDEKTAYISIRNGKMALWDLRTRAITRADICAASSWDFCAANGYLYTGTVAGEIVKTRADGMRAEGARKVCAKNIYSVVYEDGLLYTCSQDMTLKVIDASTLAVVREKKNAVKGMTRILGLRGDDLVVADGRVSLWDKRALTLRDRL